jgi:hypothetical protein
VTPSEDEATAETTDDVTPSEDEATAETTDDVTPSEDEEATAEPAPSINELVIRLGRDVTALVFRETELVAVRNPNVVRRAIRDLAATLIAGLALLTAFVFANVTALNRLTTVMPRWLAALSLCAAWLVLGSAVALALAVRAGRATRLRWWRVGRSGREGSLEDLERARADAEEAVRQSLARLVPAITMEMASASVGVAGETVGDAVEAGGDILEATDDLVEEMTENLPAGSVVNTVWDVVLAPGRLGVKVATTVLRRGNSTNRH